MKKTMMYLPDEMHAYLSRESRRRGVAMAEIAREALAAYRSAHEDAQGPALETLIGVIDEGGPLVEAASRYDELLGEGFAEGGEWERRKRHADAGGR